MKFQIMLVTAENNIHSAMIASFILKMVILFLAVALLDFFNSRQVGLQVFRFSASQLVIRKSQGFVHIPERIVGQEAVLFFVKEQSYGLIVIP